MLNRQGFSERAVRRANVNMILGEKPIFHINNKLSDKDIEHAWREASIKVFGNGAKNE